VKGEPVSWKDNVGNEPKQGTADLICVLIASVCLGIHFSSWLLGVGIFFAITALYQKSK
jgi:hypothetical protein